MQARGLKQRQRLRCVQLDAERHRGPASIGSVAGRPVQPDAARLGRKTAGAACGSPGASAAFRMSDDQCMRRGAGRGCMSPDSSGSPCARRSASEGQKGATGRGGTGMSAWSVRFLVMSGSCERPRSVVRRRRRDGDWSRASAGRSGRVGLPRWARHGRVSGAAKYSDGGHGSRR